MFSGLKWYWWLVIGAALIVSVPFKVKFIKWWSRREQDKEKGQGWKWGMTNDGSRKSDFSYAGKTNRHYKDAPACQYDEDFDQQPQAFCFRMSLPAALTLPGLSSSAGS